MEYEMNAQTNSGGDMNTYRDRFIINTAALVRSFGVGLMGVVLGIYLSRLGYSAFGIGVVVAVGLAGSAMATTVVGVAADRIGRKRFLVTMSLLTALGGLGLYASVNFSLLLVLAFLGMLNGTGTERSATYALEQAVIPGLGADERRTWNLAVYNVLIDGGGALGALGAGLPLVLQHHFGFSLLNSYQLLFLAYSGLYIMVAGLYLQLSPVVEIAPNSMVSEAISARTKTAIGKLTALFSLDAFGGGFLTDALVSYWFFRRFGLSEQDLGLVFFVVHILNALSHLGAAWLASRIGLVNTMVFTHLPSSLLLMTVPFAASAKVAIALFLARETLVEMDVPTRQSYVASLVRPSERSFASAVTNVARAACWAMGSGVAGVLMQNLAFSAPLIVGGGTKITYDLLLYKLFRRLKPPEENCHDV
jgi:MFS family permease